MQQAGKYPSNIHVSIYIVLTQASHGHVASCKESMGSDLDQNLKYFQSLKVQLRFQKPRQAWDQMKYFFYIFGKIQKNPNSWPGEIFHLFYSGLQNRYVGESNRIQHLPTHLANNTEDLLYIFIQMKILFAQHLFLQLVETPPCKEHKRKAISCNGPFYLFCNFLPKLHRYNYFDTIMKRKWDLGTVGLSNNTISCQTSQHWQSQRTLSIPIGNIWFYCRNIIYFHQVAIIRKDMIAE